MADRDVLICGNCSSQHSDLKLFIDHKQTCGSVIPSTFNNADVSAIISTPQQISQVGSQQIPVIIPPSGHASIVNLPIGMQHIILQTTTGLSQMYRIVLEPSLNATTSMNSTGQMSQSNQIPSYPPVQQVNGTGVETPYPMGNEDKTPIQKGHSYLDNKMEMDEELLIQQSTRETHTEPTMTRLAAMVPVDSSSWSSQRTDPRSSLFEPMITNVISEKTILDPISVSTASSLHTDEEDVAAFLATQLVSQGGAVLTHSHPKLRGGNVVQKYCSVVQESTPIVQQDLTFEEVGAKVVTFSLTQKNGHIGGTSGKCLSSKTHAKDTTEEDDQPKKEFEVVEKGSKRLSCSQENCNFFTQHKKDMVRHMRKHTGEKPFPCPECEMRFSRQDKLKVHQRTHSKERPYACTEPGCSYRGNEKAHLRKHKRTHTNERPYRCQFCPYGAKDGSHLTVHLRSHTGDSPFHCEMDGCSATFKTSSDLKRHEKLHTGTKPFKCPQCDYAAALKSNLKVHIRINHLKGDRYGCKSCPFLASSRKQFREHEKGHGIGVQTLGKNSRKLPDSGSVVIGTYLPSAGDKSLNVGKKSNYSTKGRRGSRFTCPKNFRCDRCGSSFVREDSLRSHIRQHDRKKVAEVSQEQLRVRATPHEEEEPPKGKVKSLCTLNYIIQGSPSHSFRGSATSDKGIVVAPKDKSAQVLISQHNQVSPPQVGTPSTDVFSSYVIAIDGIPSMCSSSGPGINLKVTQSTETPQVESHSTALNQDDPVVHVINSSLINPQSLKTSLGTPPSGIVKVIPPHVGENAEQNPT